MKLPYILTLLFTVGLSGLMAQSQPFGRHCLTPAREAFYAREGVQPESREAFEAWIARKMAQPRNGAARSIYTIPVIVHVIHEGGAPGSDRNVSAARVQGQIDVLNEDFRRLAGSPGFNNHPVGADCEIEFCLAERGPDGSPLEEPGVHRVHADSLGLNNPPYSESYIDLFIKPATIWDPYRYCNIWVTDLEGSPLTLGYARFPVSSGVVGVPGPFSTDETDGVVIDYEFFGRDGNLDPRYNQGRSCTHEIGHWLGLVHIWGDANTCSATDYCDDTPPALEAHEGCPTAAVSCGSADMYENYMDYTDDVCMNVFTQCQKLRMRTVLENSPRRVELLTSDVCSPFMSPPVANFRVKQRTGCPGFVAEFEDLSELRPSRWEWRFPGGKPAASTEREPRVQYDRRGVYAVFLKVSNDFGEDSLLAEGLITVRSTEQPAFFFYEDFEGEANDWVIENPDNQIGWELTSGIGGSLNGSRAMGLSCYEYEARGQRDRLLSPLISLEGRDGITLAFDHAYRAVGTAFLDSLYVRLSTDGGASYPHTLLALAETGQRTFATNGALTAAFNPVRDADWCYEGIDWSFCNELNLNRFAGEGQVRIMFEAVNDNGNNIFIDNVRISASCAAEAPALFELFPNPSRGEVTLLFFEEAAFSAEIDAFDLRGKRVFQTTLEVDEGFSEKTLTLPPLSPGTYLVRVRDGETSSVRKLVVY